SFGGNCTTYSQAADYFGLTNWKANYNYNNLGDKAVIVKMERESKVSEISVCNNFIYVIRFCNNYNDFIDLIFKDSDCFELRNEFREADKLIYQTIIDEMVSREIIEENEISVDDLIQVVKNEKEPKEEDFKIIYEDKEKNKISEDSKGNLKCSCDAWIFKNSLIKSEKWEPCNHIISYLKNDNKASFNSKIKYKKFISKKFHIESLENKIREVEMFLKK
ncbi:MAG: hypothetical protein M0R03_23100, partial [Novosphingobium sp.]|nr:hypothetical protein [Novosphingobium sp.]